LPVLEVSNLRKSYNGTRAVDDVSFSIEAGEVFGLLGPNGAGKSTTINIIATMVAPDGGAVAVGGTTSSQAAAYKRQLGYVPQEVSLAQRLTAEENLRLFGRLYDLSEVELGSRVAAVLEAVGLSDRASDLVATFSGGMKRRLNIAAALLHRPALFLMDEPTVGVDPQARAYIFEMVERLAAEGRAILYTTHYMEEAQRLCRRIAVIDRGRILACGTLAELIQGIRAKRDLTIQGRGLDDEVAAGIAQRLGDVPCTLEDQTAHFSVEMTGEPILDAARAAADAGFRPTAISLNEPTLEMVFLELTGRALRD